MARRLQTREILRDPPPGEVDEAFANYKHDEPRLGDEDLRFLAESNGLIYDPDDTHEQILAKIDEAKQGAMLYNQGRAARMAADQEALAYDRKQFDRDRELEANLQRYKLQEQAEAEARLPKKLPLASIPPETQLIDREEPVSPGTLARTRREEPNPYWLNKDCVNGICKKSTKKDGGRRKNKHTKRRQTKRKTRRR